MVTEAGASKPQIQLVNPIPSDPKECSFLGVERGFSKEVGWTGGVPPWENKNWVRLRTTTSSGQNWASHILQKHSLHRLGGFLAFDYFPIFRTLFSSPREISRNVPRNSEATGLVFVCRGVQSWTGKASRTQQKEGRSGAVGRGVIRSATEPEKGSWSHSICSLGQRLHPLSIKWRTVGQIRLELYLSITQGRPRHYNNTTIDLLSTYYVINFIVLAYLILHITKVQVLLVFLFHWGGN